MSFVERFIAPGRGLLQDCEMYICIPIAKADCLTSMISVVGVNLCTVSLSRPINDLSDSVRIELRLSTRVIA